jgi:tight adherence protein B
VRQRFVALAVLTLTVVVLAGSANAQEAGTTELRIESTDTTAHPDVSLVVIVPPEMIGKNLTSDAFVVFEDGDVRAVTATPVPTDGLQVVLLLDSSGSMKGEPIAAAKSAAQSFLDAMPEGVEVAVVSFADEPVVLSPFTTDKDQTLIAIADLSLGKNTALYDGLVAGSAIFDSEDGTQRALVLLSDGGDTASVTGVEDAIVGLLDANISFYAVELQSPESDPETLAQLGVATDGIVVAAEDPEGLTAVFVDVASQIVNRYELRYTSEAFGPTAVAVQAEADGVVAAANQRVSYPPPPPVEPPPEEPVVEPDVDTVAIAPVLRSGSVVVLRWPQSSSALWVGALVVFVAIAILLILTGTGRPKQRRLVNEEAQQRLSESRTTRLTNLTEQATLLAERTVIRGDTRTKSMTTLLEKAGIQLRPGEVIVISVSIVFIVAAITLLLTNLLLSLLFAVLAAIVIRAWIGRRVTKRQKAFDAQLVDVLQLMAGSIRSGFGLMAAMDTVATEISAPAGEEFRRVGIEVQLGRDVDDALTAMAARVGSEDFKWVVEAIEIHREVGGDLAEILDSVMGTVRDRMRIRRQIKTLSAEGRMSGMILALLPIVLAILITLITPEYLTVLFTTAVGRTMVIVEVVLMVIGVFWIRRITALKF